MFPDPTAGRDAIGGHGGEGEVVAIAMNAESWPPMATTDAVMSQSGSVAGMSYFTSRDTESSHRSIRSCATVCDQTCVRGRPGNVGAEADRQPTVEMIGLLGFDSVSTQRSWGDAPSSGVETEVETTQRGNQSIGTNNR